MLRRGWASRHQLHKHVNTHVYLGVWRITLNSVQAVFAWYNFRIPRFGKSKSDLANRGYHVIQALEAHIHVYTYFVYGESGLLGVGDKGKCNDLTCVLTCLPLANWDQTVHVFRDVHVFVAYYWSSHVADARACPGTVPDCTRIRYAIS